MSVFIQVCFLLVGLMDLLIEGGCSWLYVNALALMIGAYLYVSHPCLRRGFGGPFRMRSNMTVESRFSAAMPDAGSWYRG